MWSRHDGVSRTPPPPQIVVAVVFFKGPCVQCLRDEIQTTTKKNLLLA